MYDVNRLAVRLVPAGYLCERHRDGNPVEEVEPGQGWDQVEDNVVVDNVGSIAVQALQIVGGEVGIKLVRGERRGALFWPLVVVVKNSGQKQWSKTSSTDSAVTSSSALCEGLPPWRWSKEPATDMYGLRARFLTWICLGWRTARAREGGNDENS